MFLYFLKVTICWIVFYLGYSKFLSNETFFKTNRWYLLGTLLLGAGIPLLEFLPILQEDNPVVVYFQPISEGSFYVQSAVNEAVMTTFFDWEKFFIGLYIIGVAIFSIRFFIGLGKINALYRQSEIIQKENHTLVLTNQPHLPFSFFKYMFWSKDLEMNDVDGQNIITHEEAHVKGWHSIDVILLEIFSIIFWVSPMVYFYKKSLKTVHEYLADAVVLQTTPTKKYGHLLLRQSQSGLQIALANHFFHSQLKQRIVMMTRSKSRKEAIVKYLFALPVILLLLIAFSKKEAIANNDNLPTVNIEASNFENLNSIDDLEKYVIGGVDEMPRFSGCEEIPHKVKRDKCAQTKMMKFIFSNVKYPKAASKTGTQGKVIISFLVKKDGTIRNAKIKKDIGGGCGEEALRVINTMPNWIPGMKDGKAVDVEMALPVKFKLASEDVFKVVEEMPRFKNEDCEKMEDQKAQKKCSEIAMLKYIYSNVKYPKAARDAGVQGRVIIKFTVQKDGSIADAKVLRDPGGGCGAEAERVVNSMPNFVPGKQKGKAVNVSYTLPVSFKLAEPDTETNIGGMKMYLQGKEKKPLFVLDGKIVNAKGVENINPNQIENIRVLKGDAARAKYPQVGEDGVVEITLKVGDSKSGELRTHPIKNKNTLKSLGISYLKISPNPSSGIINIEYEAEEELMEIIGYDMFGKVLFKYEEYGGRRTIPNINIRNAAKGMIVVAFKKGENIYTRMVTLQ